MERIDFLVDIIISGELYDEKYVVDYHDHYRYFTTQIKKNKKLLLFLLPYIWTWDDENLDEIKHIIKSNYGSDLGFFKEALIHDDEDGSCLLLAECNVCENKEILLLAVSAAKNHNRIGNTVNIFGSDSLKKDQEFLSEVLKIYPREFEEIGQYVKLKNTVNNVLNEDGTLLEFALDEFKKDNEVIEVAVRNNLSAIQFVPLELKSNPESPFFEEWFRFNNGNVNY